MPKKAHSEEQIVAVLRQGEAGEKVGDICRRVGISEGTYYLWKKQYAGLGINELRELRQLRDENGRLKRLVADLSLDRQILQEIVSKKLWHLSIKLCLSDSCGGLETRLEHGIELVKYGSDILGQAFPFALLERRDGDAELEL